MLIESGILFGLYLDGKKQFKDRYGADPEAQEKSKEKEQHAKRDAKAVTGGIKGKNFAKKIGGGDKMQAFGAGMGATFGAMKGKRKGGKEADKREDEGKKPQTSRTKLLAKEGAKEAAKYFIDKKAREVAFEAAGETFGLSVVAYYGIKHWKVTLSILACLFLLLFMLFDNSSFDPPQPPSDQGDATPTTSDNCVPMKVNNGATSLCTIRVQYDGSAQDITITDTILPGTVFVSAGENGTWHQASNTVTWDAATLHLALSPVNITVTVLVRVESAKDNVTVYNAYTINPVGLSGGGGAALPGNLPPNSNTCSGVYASYMSATPGHQNYGDPQCQLVKKDPNGNAIINKDEILSELQSLKPTEAMAWFVCVVPNESGYNANAYLGASTSGNGAYGLVQMNPTGKGNGKYDDGEVVWQLQLSNGINYNDDVISHTFSYWPTSYDPCIRSYGVTVN